MKRAVLLYSGTLIVMMPLDFLFLGVLARDFFKAEVGPALGEVNLLAAVLFYLLYPLGIVIFVSGAAAANWQHTLLYGALFGLFCYATFDLTALALLKGWTWPAAVLDIAWGAAVTATSATLGLLLANVALPQT